MGKRLDARILPWWVGGLLTPAVVCGFGLLIGLNSTAAAGGFVLGVIVAVLLWGSQAGLLAATSSFFGLNFFFTPPLRTFIVGKVEDLVALVVFLVVSVVVSRLFSGLVAERRRAEQREHEMTHLLEVAQALLVGFPLSETLGLVARSLVEAFGLGRVEIRLDHPQEGVQSPIVAARDSGAGSGSPATLSLGDQGGAVLLYGDGDKPVEPQTLALAEAFVSQAALAVERSRLDGEARRARLESEASDLRAALFSSVTHDLKTPLASIKAAVTSLLDQEGQLGHDDVQALLDTILAETDRLGRLLANVLELARIEAGAVEPRTQHADLAELVGSVLQRLRPQINGRIVDVRIRDDLPPIAIDIVQIEQVLTNVIENALRFAPPDAPISISAGTWDSRVEVTVSDHGPGIPQAERERVFEPFYSRDRGGGRGGSGLGLAISRAILTAHNGRIRIEEPLQGGTAVLFSVPIAEGT